MKPEEWKEAIGFENRLKISSWGRVESIERKVAAHFGQRTVKQRILKTWVCKQTGYVQVGVSQKKKENVHRLVAMAFCDGYKEDLHVNHKDGNRANPYFENLEWVTPSENIRHSFQVLGRINPYFNKYSEDHPASKPVKSINIKTGDVKFYYSAMDAVREGFDSSCISRTCQSQNKSHKGYYWQYVVSGIN
jgi:hypothetical protein